MSFSTDKIIYRRTPDLNDPDCNYNGFKQETIVLTKGSVVREGHMPLPCDIVFHRDVAIPLRDNTILYADIFTPVTSEKFPVIINSTVFGKGKKSSTNFLSSMCSENEEVPGVSKSMTSGLNTFEGSDPAFFVNNGYVVVNVDIRGSYSSEGKCPYFGTQEALDDYDVIEFLASQPWCNGCVAMTGNSWLGINQWFAGAKCPPHLTCLAPWEGWHDMYRDEYMVGGIPNYPGFRYKNTFKNDGFMEDVVSNCLVHPLYDEYWEDKHAQVENITVPVYATASWTSPFHCQGTFRAWRELKTKEKWLRVHNRQEWFDSYSSENQDELLKFFDHYMKGCNNGWEKTPKVRISVLDPGRCEDIIGRAEENFPISRQNPKELFLDCNHMILSPDVQDTESSVQFCTWDESSIVTFRHLFTEDTEITGYINLKVWVESLGYNDVDLFVKVRKLDENGNEVFHHSVRDNDLFWEGIYSGPTSRQRVSLRKLDHEKSTLCEPYHTFDTVEKLLPYEIVPVEIPLFPCGLFFRAGESIELAISGYQFYGCPLAFGTQKFQKMGIDNNGICVIHAGPKHDSKLIIPVIPPK